MTARWIAVPVLVLLAQGCGTEPELAIPLTASCHNREMVNLGYTVFNDQDGDWALEIVVGTTPANAPQVVPDTISTVISTRHRPSPITVFWNEVHFSPAYSESTFATQIGQLDRLTTRLKVECPT